MASYSNTTQSRINSGRDQGAIPPSHPMLDEDEAMDFSNAYENEDNVVDFLVNTNSRNTRAPTLDNAGGPTKQVENESAASFDHNDHIMNPKGGSKLVLNEMSDPSIKNEQPTYMHLLNRFEQEVEDKCDKRASKNGRKDLEASNGSLGMLNHSILEEVKQSEPN